MVKHFIFSSIPLLLFGFFSVGLAQVKEIQPMELKKLMKENSEVQLIDVREDWEVKRAKIPQSRHIPLKKITSVRDDLDMEKVVVTYCHRGRRSKTAAEILHKLGFREVYSLEGGIEAYAVEVDSSIPRY